MEVNQSFKNQNLFMTALFEDLPVEAKEYIKLIEHYTGLKVTSFLNPGISS